MYVESENQDKKFIPFKIVVETQEDLDILIGIARHASTHLGHLPTLSEHGNRILYVLEANPNAR